MNDTSIAGPCCPERIEEIQTLRDQLKAKDEKITEFADACNNWYDLHIKSEEKLRIMELERMPVEIHSDIVDRLTSQLKAKDEEVDRLNFFIKTKAVHELALEKALDSECEESILRNEECEKLTSQLEKAEEVIRVYMNEEQWQPSIYGYEYFKNKEQGR